MSGEQIQMAIVEALREGGIDTEVVLIVLKALGIQTSS
jgi:hypothetical protein